MGRTKSAACLRLVTGRQVTPNVAVYSAMSRRSGCARSASPLTTRNPRPRAASARVPGGDPPSMDRPRAIVAKGKVEVAQGVDRMTDWQRAVRWSALAP